ncbi:MAG: hypothetical protein QM756_14240 [Polyangiaceae bacterium]
MVSTCQATNVEACHLAQQAYCLALVPANFSDEKGDACIEAVAKAYADADLTGAELLAVTELGPPCDAIVRGPSGAGESCSSDRDCDGSEGYRCALRGGAANGTCQVPELVGAGQKCAALQQTCGDGFYCDGNNCIATKSLGESCSNDYECGSVARCESDASCAPKLALGDPCTSAADCASGVCYSINGQRSCVDRIRLSPAEALCDELR